MALRKLFIIDWETVYIYTN